MTPKTASLNEIVGATRLLFHRLRATADTLHAGLEITAPMRGVMESLWRVGPQTVPQLAAARPVSRQHIQTQVNALRDRGIVDIVPNPAHKRSSLIDLTAEGRRQFEAMLSREAAILESLAEGRDADDLAVTARTLTALAAVFEDLPASLAGETGGG